MTPFGYQQGAPTTIPDGPIDQGGVSIGNDGVTVKGKYLGVDVDVKIPFGSGGGGDDWYTVEPSPGEFSNAGLKPFTATTGNGNNDQTGNGNNDGSGWTLAKVGLGVLLFPGAARLLEKTLSKVV